jgi:hypothetical protein
MAKAAAIYIVLACSTLAMGLYMVTADRPAQPIVVASLE